MPENGCGGKNRKRRFVDLTKRLRRFCFSDGAFIPQERKLSLTEGYGYGI